MGINFFSPFIYACLFTVLIFSNILVISSETTATISDNVSNVQKDHEIEMQCGGDVILDYFTSELKSPDDSIKMANRTIECIWRVIVPEESYRILLKFKTFEIASDGNNTTDYSCIDNYVEIRNGLSSDSLLIQRFCGNLIPPNIYSIGRELFVKFVNDNTRVHKENVRFSAGLEKVYDECSLTNYGCQHDCVNTRHGYKCECDEDFELQSDGKHCKNKNINGVITSENCRRPDDTETNYLCMWNIVPPPRTRIILNFTYFNLEDGEKNYYNCPQNNHVKIADTQHDHMFQVYGPYCGFQVPPQIISGEEAINIEFHTNKNAKNSKFIVHYHSVRDECKFYGRCADQCQMTVNSFRCYSYTEYDYGDDITPLD